MGVGSVFLPVAGVGEGNTYKLKDIVVICETAGQYLIPGNEYFQKLDSSTTDVEKRYTYISRDAIEDNIEGDWDDDFLQGVGWWPNAKDIIEKIEMKDFSDMLKGENAVTLTPGFAFLSNISSKKNYRINFPAAVEAETK